MNQEAAENVVQSDKPSPAESVSQQPESKPQETLTSADAKQPKKINKKIIILILFLVLLFLLFTASLILKQQLSYKQTPATPQTVTPSVVQEGLLKDESIKVQYFEREKIYETVQFPENTDSMYYSFDFYKVGTITTGKDKDGELILALVVWRGPCKGRGCRKPFRLRYIVKDKKVIFLPQNSNPSLTRGNEYFNPNKDNPFAAFGLDFAVDSNITLATLEYPKKNHF